MGHSWMGSPGLRRAVPGLVVLALVSAVRADDVDLAPIALVGPQADDPGRIASADLDGDGDLDVVATSYGGDRVAWSENLDGLAGTWQVHPILGDLDGAYALALGDADGDGALDVFATAALGDRLTVHLNRLADGAEWVHADVATDALADGLVSLAAGDLDADGHLDVAAQSQTNSELRWYRNTSGDGLEWSAQEVIALHVYSYEGHTLEAADLDADGAMDLVASSLLDERVAWHENLGGDGNQWLSHDLVHEQLGNFSVTVGDLDGDGDLDVVSTHPASANALWIENDDGTAPEAWSWLAVATDTGYAHVEVGDLDGDGDVDLIGNGPSDDYGFAFLENQEQGSTWVAWFLDSGVDWVETSITADLDSDGDLDLFVSDPGLDALGWIENRTWSRLGGSVVGSQGTPRLRGTGPLTAASPVLLRLDQAAPASSAFLVLGVARVDAPFKGGVLVPAPELVVGGLPTTSGGLQFAFTWLDPAPSGFTFYVQAWVVDAAAPFGMAATDGLSGRSP